MMQREGGGGAPVVLEDRSGGGTLVPSNLVTGYWAVTGIPGLGLT
jgi:hypothetical protein